MTTFPIARMVFAAALSILLAAPVQADEWAEIRADTVIHDGLTVIAVGQRIHRLCPTINARPIPSLAFAHSLFSHARSMGYTRSDLDRFIDDPEEQDRYTQIARRYFTERGADYDDPESLCRVGRDEIAAGSAIGRLLREG